MLLPKMALTRVDGLLQGNFLNITDIPVAIATIQKIKL